MSHTLGQKKINLFFFFCFLGYKIGVGFPYCNNKGRVDYCNTGGGWWTLPGPQQGYWSSGKKRRVSWLFWSLLLCKCSPCPSILRGTWAYGAFLQGWNICVRCQRLFRQNAPWWINEILTWKNDLGCWAQIHRLSTLVKFWHVAHPVLSKL